MTAPVIFFLPGLLFFGILVSYMDIRYRVIKNIHLAGALVYGVLIYGFFWIFLDNKIDIVPFFLNLVVSFSLAYFLYLKNLWSAGDAKLFVVFSFLTPPGNGSSLLNFSTLSLFANIFIVALIYFIFFDFRDILENLKRGVVPGMLKNKAAAFAGSCLVLVAFGWLMREALGLIGSKNAIFEVILLYGFMVISKKIVFLKPRFFVFAILGGLLLHFATMGTPVFSPLIFTLARMLKFAVFFNILDLALNPLLSPGSAAPVQKNIPFAPIMFLGAFCARTPLIENLLKFFSHLK
jgi:hypothetical protein